MIERAPQNIRDLMKVYTWDSPLFPEGRFWATSVCTYVMSSLPLTVPDRSLPLAKIPIIIGILFQGASPSYVLAEKQFQ